MGQQRERFDIAVVGGGAAGIAASVAAARQGASVCLVEASTRIGGAATNAHVGTICGLSLCGEGLATTPELNNPGFASELASLIAARSHTRLIRNEMGLAYLPYVPSGFESAAGALLAATPGVTLALSTRLVAAQRPLPDGDFLLSTEDSSRKARAIACRCCVDCSGDSLVSALLSVPTLDAAIPQASAQVFLLGGLPPLDEPLLGLTIRKALREAALCGSLPDNASYVSLVSGSLRNGSVLCKLGLLPGASPEQASSSIQLLVVHLRSHVTALSGLELLSLAPSVGVRGGRRGVGRETLSEQAITASARSSEGVALGFWPMELWDSPARPKMLVSERPAPYEIPLGALCSAHLPGLYFAGRGISATDHAIASARVIGTCFSTGFAAGRAAVGEVRREGERVVIAELRRLQVEPFYSPKAGDSGTTGVFEHEPGADKNRRDTSALA